MLQYSFTWKQLSVIAGVTHWRFYFRLLPGAIKKEQIVQFLKALLAHIGKKLLIIWDRLPGHRSALVRRYVESLEGRMQIEFLPAYAPELNPVEFLWGHLKQHEVPNFCAENLGQLKHFAGGRLRSMQRRPTLVTAFWQQAELF